MPHFDAMMLAVLDAEIVSKDNGKKALVRYKEFFSNTFAKPSSLTTDADMLKICTNEINEIHITHNLTFAHSFIVQCVLPTITRTDGSASVIVADIFILWINFFLQENVTDLRKIMRKDIESAFGSDLYKQIQTLSVEDNFQDPNKLFYSTFIKPLVKRYTYPKLCSRGVPGIIRAARFFKDW